MMSFIATVFVAITFFNGPDQITVFASSDFVRSLDGEYATWSVDDVNSYVASSNGVLAVPTPLIVDQISGQATCKVKPLALDPSKMNSAIHSAFAERQVRHCENPYLVNGHKKDIVQTSSGKMGLYGWHYPDGKRIQSFYDGHTSDYKDYSQGFRPILNTVIVNGQPLSVKDAIIKGYLGE